ncbi:aldo/keto reductase [Gluconobacter kondonii]|uniref:aldo/keto reductase n=1 Tax=Gluconobacter kondonii TaxID=941463 RepID=UPI0019823927|nr:aldo/keto reductase [Gluconobacter kondonii]MBN3867320.1 aldo/keto reductase [Gluconobacter kondonii]MBS1053030.1 aldo/keto reductase [Gluconobacter kondonii]MBS1056760.1 aldo/keto reductase [Gluconobacter kondonii]MBS1077320.1 aldo/keto reductase [Gluconobacter kondonii]
MKTVTLRNGVTVPALGMGTWNIGDSASRRSSEIESLRKGLEAGLRVIDTAEMYGDGRSEDLVGEAIADVREDVYLVSKIVPSNASYDGVYKACQRSLEHLETEWLDLYLLHWHGGTPLEETVQAFEDLKDEGLIRGWGVSNFDVEDMEEIESLSENCLVNQILYNLEHRGTEFDLLDHDLKSGTVTMAYSPLGQGGELLEHPALKEVASRHETSLGPADPAQIALAWVLRRPNVLAIPKAASEKHVAGNLASLEISLTDADLKTLDSAFPSPKRKLSLAMI